MKVKNETIESKEIKQQIDKIKGELKAELEERIREYEKKIAELKKEYKQKEQEQTRELKRQRVNALSHNFYNNNYKRLNKQPSLKDQYAIELFGRLYKECNNAEQKVIYNKYVREYRKRLKDEKLKENVRGAN